MLLHYGIAGPVLTLLSRLLRHVCQVTVLLFFVPVLGPGNTRVKDNIVTNICSRAESLTFELLK
jgi:hypothetical protein